MLPFRKSGSNTQKQLQFHARKECQRNILTLFLIFFQRRCFYYLQLPSDRNSISGCVITSTKSTRSFSYLSSLLYYSRILRYRLFVLNQKFGTEPFLISL